MSLLFTHPHVTPMVYVFLSSVEKEKKVFDGNVPGFLSI